MNQSLFDLGDPIPAAATTKADPCADGSRWLFEKAVVVIRGQSPRMVWFTLEGASVLTQRTMLRDEFLKKAQPYHA